MALDENIHTTSSRKHSLRERMKHALGAMPAADCSLESKSVCDRLSALGHDNAGNILIPFDATVLAYLPIEVAPELDLTVFIRAHAAGGGTVCLPAIDWEASTMQPAVVGSSDLPFSLDRCVVRRFGVPEPRADAVRVKPDQLHVVLVPGLAFDRRGHRLGRGGGFYDRFLSGLAREKSAQHACGIRSDPACGGNTGNNARCPSPVFVGVCFDRQIVDDVPTEEGSNGQGDWHDVPVDVVVSSAGVVRCNVR